MKRRRDQRRTDGPADPVTEGEGDDAPASLASSLLSPELQAQLGITDGAGGDAVVLGSRKKKQKIGPPGVKRAAEKPRITAPVPQSRASKRAEKSKTRKLAALQVRCYTAVLLSGVLFSLLVSVVPHSMAVVVCSLNTSG